MDKAHYVNRLRKESFVLNPKGNFGASMKFLDLNSRSDIDRNLIRLDGSTVENGKYYLPDKRIWEIAVIPALKMKLEELTRRFEKHCQTRVNEGRQRPSKWPDELADELAKIEAGIKVAQEEVIFLNEARKNAPVPKEELEPVKHRRRWGSGRLRHGVLVELGGFRISPDKEGVL